MNGEKPQDKQPQGWDNGSGPWYRFLGMVPRRQLALSLFYGMLRIVIAAIWPFFLYRTLQNTGIGAHSRLPLHIMLVVLLLVLGTIASHLQSGINIRLLKTFTLGLIERIWKKMNALDWLTFHVHNRVYYFDMLMVETWRLRAGMAALLESLIINSLIAAILSLFIAWISWPLFLACLAGLLVMGTGHFISTLKTRPLLKQFHHAWREQHHWVSKCVDQFDLLKMDRGYETAAAANLEKSGIFLAANTQLLADQAKWRNINQLVANMVRISVFIIGIYWVRADVVSLNDLLLVLLIVSIVQGNVAQVPTALNHFIEAQESLKTISNFFALNDEQADLQQPFSSLPPIKKIAIRDLSYGYNHKPVIDRVNIDLEAGKIYLWRGANGSGKSTAAHILLGLLQPEQGSLAINDHTMPWNELKSLRSRFAFLNQDSPIFMGSIKENALFGHVQPETAWDTLQTTWLSGLLPKTDPSGSRIVGERGEGLSGGEAKRIALIRELLRSSELLILDEPLNHLDEFVIGEIKREILMLKANTIIIIISHQSGFESIADEIREF